MTEPQRYRGRRLQRARQDAGLEQEDAAEKLGISRVTLSRIENDVPKKISAELVAKMAELYRVPADRLMEPGAPRNENVSRETPVPAAVNETPAAVYGETGPRVTQVAGRPLRMRKWLQAEMGAWVDANIPEDEFRAARQFLESEDTQGFFAGKDPNDRRSEEQILNDMKALAYAVRRSWRVRGFKIGQEPVE